jgi:site-specific DNA-methyltransferase (adenine-specific)
MYGGGSCGVVEKEAEMMENWTDKISVFNGDCMELMGRYPDGWFDLAIVDPPYGIGESGGKSRTRKKHKNKVKHLKKCWDNEPPNKEYFDELFRVSKNQIIWGANYFTNYLPPSMGWIFWDKQIGGDFSDGELAFTSFNRALKMFTKWSGNNGVARIHPTQKPIDLYRWILDNYAKPDFKILDTHLGSGSHAIAAHYFGCELVASELDSEYYEASKKRFQLVTSQSKLF